MWIGGSLVILGLALVGCGKKGDNETTAPTPTTEQGDNVQNKEPALSEEAKKLYQFADLADGEVYAKINIQDYGTITVKFFPQEAPLAVENFMTHAREGYYDNVSFHRVIEDFMIQGGDPVGDGTGGESIWGEAFQDEFSDKLHPLRGALCMANAGADTNGSQFFIVQADAEYIASMERLLEERYELTLGEYIKEAYNTTMTEDVIELYEKYGGTPWLYGHHTVFGQVMDGYEVLDAIAGTEVNGSNAPLETVLIESIEIVE